MSKATVAERLPAGFTRATRHKGGRVVHLTADDGTRYMVKRTIITAEVRVRRPDRAEDEHYIYVPHDNAVVISGIARRYVSENTFFYPDAPAFIAKEVIAAIEAVAAVTD